MAKSSKPDDEDLKCSKSGSVKQKTAGNLAVEIMDGNRALYHNFSLAAANLLPFVGELRDPSHAKMALIYSIGRHLQYNKCDRISERVCAIGEILAPQFKEGRSLSETKARQKLVQVVHTLLSSKELSRVSDLDTKIWNRESGEQGFLSQLAFTGESKEYWPVVIPITKRAFVDKHGHNMLTPQIAMAILTLITVHGKPILKDEIVYILLSMHLGLLEKVKIDDYMSSIPKDIKAQLNIASNIRKELVETVHKAYKDDFDDNVAKEIFVFWDSWVAPNIRLLIQPEVKSSYEKLESINKIKKAIILYPDFYWEMLTTSPGLYQELVNVSEALSLIVSNPYYIYKKDYGVIKSSNFPTVEAVATVLLDWKKDAAEKKGKNNKLSKKILDTINAYFEGKEMDPKKGVSGETYSLVATIKRNAGLIVPEGKNRAYRVEDVHKRIDEIMKNGCMEKYYSLNFSCK